MKSLEVCAGITGLICLIASFIPGCEQAPQVQPSGHAATDTVFVSVPEVVTVYKDRVEYKTRTKTVVKYLPPEGKVTFDSRRYTGLVTARDSLREELGRLLAAAPKDSIPVSTPAAQSLIAQINSASAQLSDPEQSGLLSIQTRGICLRPLAGIGWNGAGDFFAGAKVAYWGKYGAAVGATSRQVGGGITRRLDFIPYTHNIEGVLFYGLPFKTDTSGLFAGIAVGL